MRAPTGQNLKMHNLLLTIVYISIEMAILDIQQSPIETDLCSPMNWKNSKTCTLRAH
jgi:hypothetical protein